MTLDTLIMQLIELKKQVPGTTKVSIACLDYPQEVVHVVLETEAQTYYPKPPFVRLS